LLELFEPRPQRVLVDLLVSRRMFEYDVFSINLIIGGGAWNAAATSSRD
jgi:hypothetical protein